MDEIENTVVQLELENARLEELRDDFNLENEELRRELEEKDGKNARIKLILSNARNLKDCGLIGNRGYNKQAITNQPLPNCKT